MDGIETARQMQRLAIDGNLPKVIMVSAYDREDITTRAADVGIFTCLVKPVIPAMLAEAILSAIGQDSRHPPQIAKGPEASPEATDIHVLLVEDNEINQLVTVEALQRAGFKVSIANDGREAVDAVQNHAFDCVLMDVQMPVMDGYQATREIRASPRFSALPIIAMTANAMVGDRDLARAAGMNDYVSKPIEPDHLIAVVRKWVAQTTKVHRDDRG
jgi:CheY-like chemotaxis protein